MFKLHFKNVSELCVFFFFFFYVQGKSTNTFAAPASSSPASSSPASRTSSQLPKSATVSGTSSGGMFGGLKKGFLFGGSSSSSSHKKNTQSVKPVELMTEKPERTKKEDDIPFISPKAGKTQSDLTIDEVQEAMSEVKGLLDNQGDMLVVIVQICLVKFMKDHLLVTHVPLLVSQYISIDHKKIISTQCTNSLTP